MLVLSETTDRLQIVLSGSITTNQLECVSCWRDVTTTAYTPGRTLVLTNNTTDADLVGSPNSSTQRIVDSISIYNKDTVLQNVTVKYDANGTEKIIWKGDLGSGGRLEYAEGTGWAVTLPNPQGYAINVQALTSSPADTTAFYFGMKPSAITTTAGQNKIYIRKAGTLKIAEIYTYAGTAGTAENVSMYVRVNNSADYLIQTLGAATNERIFSNTALSIALAVGDYIEIKCVPPAWATNPLTFIVGGYVYIE